MGGEYGICGSEVGNGRPDPRAQCFERYGQRVAKYNSGKYGYGTDAYDQFVKANVADAMLTGFATVVTFGVGGKFIGFASKVEPWAAKVAIGGVAGGFAAGVTFDNRAAGGGADRLRDRGRWRRWGIAAAAAASGERDHRDDAQPMQGACLPALGVIVHDTLRQLKKSTPVTARAG